VAAVTDYADEVGALVGTLGLRKTP